MSQPLPHGGGPLLFSALDGLSLDLTISVDASTAPAAARTSRSLQDFLKELSDTDRTLKSWALEKGLDVSTVYSVRHGRLKGQYGEARRVMKAMGLPVPKA